ncbi:MAG TPA: AsnC family transcriptional regulator [Candidatus Bathyarchaeia archaeon]|nr:AsnC family transcriptional regulator [Candidatus Bathyarchaeia archaeon]
MTILAQNVPKSKTKPAKPTGVPLDALDIHLLREILQGSAALPLDPNFRKSFRTIARKLRVDQDTVRYRMKRLEQMGFITDWRILLNPHILRLRHWAIGVDVPTPTSKDDVIGKLKLMPDIFMIINYFGTLLGIVFASEADRSPLDRAELIRRLSNASNAPCMEIFWPEYRTRLSATDWKILRSLNPNPRKSCTSISQETGSSTRTVTRRLQRMVSEKGVFALAVIDPKALHGTVLASMNVGYSPRNGGELNRKILEQFNEYIWYLFFTLPSEQDVQHTVFNFALPNISKAREILEWTRKQPNILDLRIDLMEDHHILLQNLDHYIERDFRVASL